ncbi:hypothetical protein EG830_12605 [bacterium]|nr:hypothetical protein [bacterium]
MEDKDIDKLREEYLAKHIYAGLKDLNTGFDAQTIRYFSKEEFEILLDRVEAAGIGIYGIEPWRDGEYYDVWTCEDFKCDPTNPEWYRMAFDDFATRGVELQYAASYYVPAKLIMEQ